MDQKKNLKIRVSLHRRLKLYAALVERGVESLAAELLEEALAERFAKRGLLDPKLAQTMTKELAAMAAASRKRKKSGGA